MDIIPYLYVNWDNLLQKRDKLSLRIIIAYLYRGEDNLAYREMLNDLWNKDLSMEEFQTLDDIIHNWPEFRVCINTLREKQ